MKSYHSIKAEIAKLEKQAEALRANEQQGAVSQIRKLMAEFGLSAADLAGAGTGRKVGRGKGKRQAAANGSAGKPTVGVPKYRDPKTQKTWTGRGKPPGWIAGVKNRDAYLIEGAPAAAAAPAPKPAVKAAPGRKAAGKPAKKLGRKPGRKPASAAASEAGAAAA